MAQQQHPAGEHHAGDISFEKGIASHIIRLACLQVAGVAGITKGAGRDVKKILTRKYQDGVLVESESGGLFIDVYVSVYYGAKVHEVAYKIQHAIKENVEAAIGQKVLRVNVNVTDVVFAPEEEGKQAEYPQYGLEDKKLSEANMSPPDIY